MDFANVSIIVLVVILLVLAALFFVVGSFKLPKSYLKNEKARSDIRVRLMEKEYEEKMLKDAAPPEE